MNVWPVITRELRAQSRQRFTFALREIGVLGLLGWAFYFYVTRSGTSPDSMGGRMFHDLHVTLYLAIWILVPLAAADCLSRERREGTLGLLFLTPLKAADVVIAKSIAHGLRAATLILAVLPVLAVPILMGGVSWQYAVLAALTNLCALCWALAAALVASSGTRSGLRAMVGAVAFALVGLPFSLLLPGWIALQVSGRQSMGSPRFEDSIMAGIQLSGLGPNFPADPRLVSVGIWQLVFTAAGGAVAVAVLIMIFAVTLVAWQIRRNWRDEPPAAWVRWWQRSFCTPVLGKKFFRAWMRWLLERNPIGWLERRTWTGRLVTWAWFAVIISVYSAVLTDNAFFQHSDGTQTTMAWLMMGSIAASVAGSFRRERESGVLELLLVAPMTTSQIIGGRLRGLWGQFLPAVVVLFGIWGYFAQIFHDWGAFPKIFFFAGTYLTLPVIGLYFSVRSRSYIGALLATLVFSLLLPQVAERLTAILVSTNSSAPFDMTFGCRASTVFFQVLFAIGFGRALYHRLERRDFPMERALT